MKTLICFSCFSLCCRKIATQIKTYCRPVVPAPSSAPPIAPPPPPLPLSSPLQVLPRTGSSSSSSSSSSTSSDGSSTSPSVSTAPSEPPSPSGSSTHSFNAGDNLPAPPERPQPTAHKKKNQEFVRKLQSLQSLLDSNNYACSSYSTKQLSP